MHIYEYKDGLEEYVAHLLYRGMSLTKLWVFLYFMNIFKEYIDITIV